MSNAQEVGGPKMEKSLQQVGTDSLTAATTDGLKQMSRLEPGFSWSGRGGSVLTSVLGGNASSSSFRLHSDSNHAPHTCCAPVPYI